MRAASSNEPGSVKALSFSALSGRKMLLGEFDLENGLRPLSNLRQVKKSFDVGKGIMVGSVEAGYVMKKKFKSHPAAVAALSDGGPFSSLERYEEFVLETGLTLGVNVKLWKGADGILAKMIGNPNSEAAKKIRENLQMPEPSIEIFDEETDPKLWATLHEAKFEACPEFRNALKATCGTYLYEQDRKNGQLNRKNAQLNKEPTFKKPTFWGACFCRDGTFRGQNKMGQMLMALRKTKFSEPI